MFKLKGIFDSEVKGWKQMIVNIVVRVNLFSRIRHEIIVSSNKIRL